MSVDVLTVTLRTIDQAATPADLFGDRPADGDLADAHRAYLLLARAVHPDAAPDHRKNAASAAFTKLSSLWMAFAGTTGSAGPTVMTTARSSYVLIGRRAVGDIANLYDVRFERDAVLTSGVLKLARNPRNSDLLAAEARVLRILRDRGDAKYAAYAPELIDSFRHRDPSGVERRANVFAPLAGFMSLAEVRCAYPDGLDARDVAWMWRRLLVALGYIHSAGIVHGAVLPEHVMIHPEQHGLVLIDFAYAVDEPGQRLAAMVPHRADLYAPEVVAKQPVSPATDIYMAHRTLETLFDDVTPRQLHAFVAGCTLDDPAQRPSDAWALLNEYDELSEQLFGPRRFRPFAMPEAV